MLSSLQCYYVAVLSHAILTGAGCVGGVSIVIGQHYGAVSQGCSNATGQWDALWDGSNHSRAVRPVSRWVSVEVSVVAVGYPVGVAGCQTVVLQNEVSIVVFIVTVALCNAVAMVTTDYMTNGYSINLTIVVMPVVWHRSWICIMMPQSELCLK